MVERRKHERGRRLLEQDLPCYIQNPPTRYVWLLAEQGTLFAVLQRHKYLRIVHYKGERRRPVLYCDT